MKVFERYHVPAPESLIWGGVVADFAPGHQDPTWTPGSTTALGSSSSVVRTPVLIPDAVKESNAYHSRRVQGSNRLQSSRSVPTTPWDRGAGRRSPIMLSTAPPNTARQVHQASPICKRFARLSYRRRITRESAGRREGRGPSRARVLRPRLHPLARKGNDVQAGALRVRLAQCPHLGRAVHRRDRRLSSHRFSVSNGDQ